MSSLSLRIWSIASLTLALSAVIARLGGEFTGTIPAGSLVVVILLMFAILGTYALILYLAIKPSLKS